ncbi:hypothetical protein [Hymenobacter weizhouensis]|uniref:hypothetical protein n=1 Tax=Hymenobacter sp. YIM 151500-1 TaxID=2987689 RepID=UPI002226686A|nr:hypothetical protein [Hymenobacter sp. YIM 151500-1]UYZ62413.1 hypothetical protein OIS53_15605 [Hymenobacter sp. YIM 151500-1]
MTKQLVLSALALATLALNACSSEPSDWRPDKKVSLDMVAPGSRSSDNFDQHTAAASHNEKGGAVATPISSGVVLDEPKKEVSAEAARSANDTTAARTKQPGTVQNAVKSQPAPAAEQPQH